MSTPAAALEQMIDTGSKIDACSLPLMGEGELLSLMARVEELGRMVDALRASTAGEVAQRSDRIFGADGLAATRGCRNAAELLERVTGASSATARRRLRVAALTGPRSTDTGTPLPPLFAEVGAALEQESIGLDAADAITKELHIVSARASVDDMLVAERMLVASARGQLSNAEGVATQDGAVMPIPADLVRVQARAWRDALDPDGVEPRAEEALQHRDFWISRTARDGLHSLGGRLTPEIAALALATMDAVLSPRTAPKFMEAEEEVERGLVHDPRTPGQQRADAFAAMLASFGSSSEYATPPVVLVTTTQEAIDEVGNSAGTGRVSGVDEPIPLSTVKQFVCDGGTQSVIPSPNGRVIKLGSKSRFFTKAQRRAIAARDGLTCIIPGCPIPVTAAEAHHVVPDRSNGPTRIDNGVLACWWHHKMLDAGIWRITMVDGRPRVEPPPWLARLARPARQKRSGPQRT